MPMNIHDETEKLKAYYLSLPGYQKWFFPTELANALTSTNVGTLAVYQAFHASTSWFHQIFFSALTAYARLIPSGFGFIGLPEILTILNRVGLLQEDSAEINFVTVMNHNDPTHLARALCKPNHIELLNGSNAQANFMAIAQGIDPYWIASTLTCLNNVDLLSGEKAQINRHMIAAHNNLCRMAHPLDIINRLGLLTGEHAQANFEAIAKHEDPTRVNELIELLEKVGLFRDSAQANFDRILTYKRAYLLISGLKTLEHAHLWTRETAQTIFYTLASVERPGNVADILVLLNSVGIEIQVHLDAVAKLERPYDIESVLRQLISIGLLSGQSAEVNFKAIAQHERPYNVDEILKLLVKTKLLRGESAQSNFLGIVSHKRSDDLKDGLEQLINDLPFTDDNAQANFDALVRNKQADAVAKTLVLLNTIGLLTPDNCNAVANHNYPKDIANALELYSKEGFEIDQSIFLDLANHPAPWELVKAFIALNRTELSTGEEGLLNRQMIAAHKNPYIAAVALDILNQANLLVGNETQANRHIIATHTNVTNLVSALKELQRVGLLSGVNAQAIFLIIANHQELSVLVGALIFANNAARLAVRNDAQAIFVAIIHAQNPRGYADNLASLSTPELLTIDLLQANCYAIAGHVHGEYIIRALKLIHTAGLLTDEAAQDNLNAIINYDTYHARIANDLELLTNAGLLTGPLAQTNFNHILRYGMGLWRIPPHELTQARFTQEVEAARRREHGYQNRFAVAVAVAAPVAATLNAAQSTHTASVHATTDLTAWLLSARHSDSDINALQSLQPLKEQLNTLTPSDDLSIEVIRTANVCLERLDKTAVSICIHQEQKATCLRLIQEMELQDNPVIQQLLPQLEADKLTDTVMSLNRFVSWVFKEIEQDKSSSYLEAFAKALYECQRGYNLNEAGEDDEQQADRPICYGGTANKFCERLKGLSPLIQFVFINDQTIALKIKQLTLNLMLKHCQNLSLQAIHGGTHEKAIFCQSIDDLMNIDKASDVFTAIFSEERFFELLTEEFKTYSQVLRRQIEAFRVNSLPYLPAINLAIGNNDSFYSPDYLKQFKALVDIKMSFDADAAKAEESPASTQNALEQFGLFGNPSQAAEASTNTLNPTI